MRRSLWLDPIGGIIALVTLLFSWYLFTSDTSMLLHSFVAAFLTSCLVWASYIMLRWLTMSIKSD